MSDHSSYTIKIDSEVIRFLTEQGDVKLIAKIKAILKEYAEGQLRPTEIKNFPLPPWFFHDIGGFRLFLTFNEEHKVIVLDCVAPI